jgi:hypothetical protein
MKGKRWSVIAEGPHFAEGVERDDKYTYNKQIY